MHVPSIFSFLAILHLTRPALGAYIPGSASASPSASVSPNKSAARRNAHRIFNTLHSACRQWGSSTDHNGMSFFRVTVPEGSYFFHGAVTSDRPTGLEWLAFEIEHAQNFARPRGPGPPPRLSDAEDWDGLSQRHSVHGANGVFVDPESQHPIGVPDQDEFPPEQPGPDPSRPSRGYLQTYQAARPLNLLYIDGMGAGKSGYGTLDSQDFILRGKSPQDPGDGPGRGWYGEKERAEDLCKISDEWERQGGVRIDGFMRMEAGFEIIYCRFEQGGGLDLLSVDASALVNETGWVDPQVQMFEWIRACALRYDGFPRASLSIDWSSMASAYFYDVNFTNPDATRSELPRLLDASSEDRAAIKADVQETMTAQRQRGNIIDWQGLVDLLVARYSDRLALMSERSMSFEDMRHEVNFLMFSYVEFGNPSASPSLDRCRVKHLETALAIRQSWTHEDELIYAAIDKVAEDICSALKDMWEILGQGDASIERPKQILEGLKSRLAWTTWKRCKPCESTEEVCFVAMFPFGSTEDHYTPRCKNKTEMTEGRGNERYWNGGPSKPRGKSF